MIELIAVGFIIGIIGLMIWFARRDAKSDAQRDDMRKVLEDAKKIIKQDSAVNDNPDTDGMCKQLSDALRRKRDS